MKNERNSFLGGFTLIELLVVISVLGVLAAGTFVAINPGERLAQARDAARKTAVGQLVHASQSYTITHNGTPPPESKISTTSSTWIQGLVDAGELRTVPPVVNWSTKPVVANWQNNTPYLFNECINQANQNNYCYTIDDSPNLKEYTIFVLLESNAENIKCISEVTRVEGVSTSVAFMYSSLNNKIGIVCIDANTFVFNGDYTYLQ